jgi:hypothetical protein
VRNPESRAHEKCEDEDAEQSTLAGVERLGGRGAMQGLCFLRSELLRYILVQTVLSFVADSSPWCSVSKFRLIGSYCTKLNLGRFFAARGVQAIQLLTRTAPTDMV